MGLQDDRGLYAVESSLLVGVLAAWALVALLAFLRRSRAELFVGLPIAVAVAARVAALVVLSVSPALASIRGPDERTFTAAAAALEATPVVGTAWPATAAGDLLVFVFAAQFRLLESYGTFSLRIVQVAVAVAGICLLAAAVYDLAGRWAATVFAWIAALESAGVFFSGLLHKEALVMLGEGLVVLGAVRFWQRRDLIGALALAAGCTMAMATRPYAGAVLVLAALMIALHAGFRRLGPDRRRSVALVAGVSIVLAGGGALALTSADPVLDRLQRSQDANASDSSNLRLAPVDFSSPGALATNVPGRMVDLVSQPYPWQLENWSQRLGVLGTLAAWTLLLAVVLGFVIDPRAAYRRALPLVYIAVMITAGYGLSVGNAGTGFRYRTHLVLVLAAAAAVLLGPRVGVFAEAWRSRRERRVRTVRDAAPRPA